MVKQIFCNLLKYNSSSLWWKAKQEYVVHRDLRYGSWVSVNVYTVPRRARNKTGSRYPNKVCISIGIWYHRWTTHCVIWGQVCTIKFLYNMTEFQQNIHNRIGQFCLTTRATRFYLITSKCFCFLDILGHTGEWCANVWPCHEFNHGPHVRYL